VGIRNRGSSGRLSVNIRRRCWGTKYASLAFNFNHPISTHKSVIRLITLFSTCIYYAFILIKMESTWWYLIAFGGFGLVSFLLWGLKFFVPSLWSFYVRHIKLPLFVQRRRYWDSVTRLEAGLVLVFFLVNLAIILIPFISLDWRQIARRAAFAAGVNMIPLCLGGRMGTIVQTLNIHRSSYLLFHHWVGRIAIVEGLSHAVIMVALRPAPGERVLSGWIVS
jgi:hypothetical protein